MTQPVLHTDRLTLRPFQVDDIDPLHEIFKDRHAMRYFGPHETRAETEQFVHGTIAAAPAVSRDFVLETKGQVIGKAGMWHRPEIGFFIAPAWQRRGYAREALGAICPHLFKAYDMAALTADVDPRNTASIGLLESLGFRETHRAEKTIEIAGEWCDSVYLALDRP